MKRIIYSIIFALSFATVLAQEAHVFSKTTGGNWQLDVPIVYHANQVMNSVGNDSLTFDSTRLIQAGSDYWLRLYAHKSFTNEVVTAGMLLQESGNYLDTKYDDLFMYWGKTCVQAAYCESCPVNTNSCWITKGSSSWGCNECPCGDAPSVCFMKIVGSQPPFGVGNTIRARLLQ